MLQPNTDKVEVAKWLVVWVIWAQRLFKPQQKMYKQVISKCIKYNSKNESANYNYKNRNRRHTEQWYCF